MRANNNQKRQIKKRGGFLLALIHFITILALETGACYVVLFSGLIKADSFLSLLACVGALIFLKLLMKPISCRDSNAIVSTIYFMAMHAITIVLPVLIYIVIHSVTMAKNGLTFNSFPVIIIRILLLASFSELFEENLRNVFFNLTFAKYYVKRFSFLWITPIATVLSFAAQIAGFRLFFGLFPNSKLILFMGIIEIYLSLFYLRGSIASEDKMDTTASKLCRFFMTFMIYAPLCIFRGSVTDILLPSAPILFLSAVVTAILLVYTIANRKELDASCYDTLKKWNIPEERLYRERDFVKNKTLFWRKNDDINISTYVIISIIAIALMFAIHFALHITGLGPVSCSLSFVRDNGISFITTLISSTFLIVSFLSFLGDKDDKVLWTDMRSYRLINPPIFNFIGLSVFAFASLAAESICFVFQYDYLFLISFLAGMFFLTYLTFLVIISYFRRKETIDKLSEYAISTLFNPENDFDDWHIITDELYENAARMIEDKNWSKLQEVYDYLINMYNGIRNAQIQEWLRINGCQSEVRADDYYAETFSAFTRRCDIENNRMFDMVDVNGVKDKTKFAYFNKTVILDELTRVISLMDCFTLKLLINRNKKSVLVLKSVDSSVIERFHDENGESLACQIEALSSDFIKKDTDLLCAIVKDDQRNSDNNDRISYRQNTNRKYAFELQLSIGTLFFDFSRIKGTAAKNEPTLIRDYMLELCKNSYSDVLLCINPKKGE